MHIFSIIELILLIFLSCVFELFRAGFLWPVTCTVFGFLINWTFIIIIIKNEMLNCASPYSIKFLCFYECCYTLYCSNALTFSTVSDVMTLFPAVYISSFSKSLLLLWSLPKCFLLLKSLVWLLLL